MTTDEGRAALEAALRALEGPHESETAAVSTAIRAYFTALPGWRLVPIRLTDEMASKIDMLPSQDPEWLVAIGAMLRCMLEAAPPPPGLEEG